MSDLRKESCDCHSKHKHEHCHCKDKHEHCHDKDKHKHSPCKHKHHHHHSSCRPKIRMYYRTNISPEDPKVNASESRFVTVPEIDVYRGIQNRFMTKKDWTTYTKNIITFVSMRTPGTTFTTDTQTLNIPNLYNETVSINVEPYDKNYIQGTANYVDNSTGFETTIPFVDYPVSSASGIFKGYKNIRIIFYPPNTPPPPFESFTNVRTVEIT